jgi:hypothetical protein
MHMRLLLLMILLTPLAHAADTLENYRKDLTCINPAPIDMQEGSRELCADPRDFLGPHYNPGVVYYANRTAIDGIGKLEAGGAMPVGAILVKEKQEKRTADSVKIITVMKKIKEGRGVDTWDYSMIDVKTWKPVADVTSESCIECHRGYAKYDSISPQGHYLIKMKPSQP